MGKANNATKNNIENFCSFNRRNQLIKKRQLINEYITGLNLFSVLAALLLAELEIQSSLDIYNTKLVDRGVFIYKLNITEDHLRQHKHGETATDEIRLGQVKGGDFHHWDSAHSEESFGGLTATTTVNYQDMLENDNFQFDPEETSGDFNLHETIIPHLKKAQSHHRQQRNTEEDPERIDFSKTMSIHNDVYHETNKHDKLHQTLHKCRNNVKEFFHHEFKPYAWATYINVFMTLANMVAVYCSFRYYSIEMRIYKYDNSVAPDLKFLKTHLRFGRVIEIFIEIFHPLSYIKGVNFMTHPYLYFFPLTRLLLLSRWFILRSSVYTSLMTEAIATLNHINFGTLSFENFRMIYRHYVHQYAVEITVISMIITWTLFAWLVRLAEARFGILTCLIGHPNVFYNYKDMLWLVPITMTTIGYGDIYPKSLMGQFFIVCVGFYGLVVTAHLVSVVTGGLNMTRRERQVFDVLEKDKLRKDVREKAAILLQRIWRLYHHQQISSYLPVNQIDLEARNSVLSTTLEEKVLRFRLKDNIKKLNKSIRGNNKNQSVSDGESEHQSISDSFNEEWTDPPETTTQIKITGPSPKNTMQTLGIPGPHSPALSSKSVKSNKSHQSFSSKISRRSVNFLKSSKRKVDFQDNRDEIVSVGLPRSDSLVIPENIPMLNFVHRRKTHVPLVTNISVLKAMTDFRAARIRLKYISSDNIDLIGIGIDQTNLTNKLDNFLEIVDRTEQRQNLIEKVHNRKIDDINYKLESILYMLKTHIIDMETGKPSPSSSTGRLNNIRRRKVSNRSNYRKSPKNRQYANKILDEPEWEDLDETPKIFKICSQSDRYLSNKSNRENANSETNIDSTEQELVYSYHENPNYAYYQQVKKHTQSLKQKSIQRQVDLAMDCFQKTPSQRMAELKRSESLHHGGGSHKKDHGYQKLLKSDTKISSPNESEVGRTGPAMNRLKVVYDSLIYRNRNKGSVSPAKSSISTRKVE